MKESLFFTIGLQNNNAERNTARMHSQQWHQKIPKLCIPGTLSCISQAAIVYKVNVAQLETNPQHLVVPNSMNVVDHNGLCPMHMSHLWQTDVNPKLLMHFT